MTMYCYLSVAMKTFAIFLVLALRSFSLAAQNQSIHSTLPIGSRAPDFSLPGIDGKMYSLDTFNDAPVLAIVFTCNHCPTAQAYEQRIIQLTSDYATKGVRLVAINPNNPEALRLDELGWSDVGDSFEDMSVRAKDKHFNFPYLYDGETEAASVQYGPVATPHIFIFDQDRMLRYSGRIDDQENPRKTPTNRDARMALDAVLSHQTPPPPTRVFGCSVKWIEKSNWIEKARSDWSKEPVTVSLVDVKGIQELLKNPSDKVRLVNVWATWCGPCVVEFPALINLARIYKERDFEFVSVSADDPGNQEKVLKFLKNKQASGTNFLFNEDNKYKLMDAVDPAWQGALPYTLVVEPDGKVIYSRQGAIDEEELRQVIFRSSFIGRLYK